MGQYRSMTQTGKVGIEYDGFYCRILSGSRVCWDISREVKGAVCDSSCDEKSRSVQLS